MVYIDLRTLRKVGSIVKRMSRKKDEDFCLFDYFRVFRVFRG